MLVHPTVENLKTLKLFGMVKALEAQMRSQETDALKFEDRLGLLVDHELVTRETQKLGARLRHAKLRQTACIEDLDLSSPRGIDRTLLNSLSQSNWISTHRNILISGPSGVGKSYLACALAHQACRDGFSASYQRSNRLFEELAIARASGCYPRRIAALSKRDVLVIDDFAMSPLNGDQRKDLLEILDERFQKRSTIVISQLPVEHWYEVIGDPTFADAILDRLIHNSYKLSLKGESMRKKKYGGDSIQ